MERIRPIATRKTKAKHKSVTNYRVKMVIAVKKFN
jgi:hypothetical protein